MLSNNPGLAFLSQKATPPEQQSGHCSGLSKNGYGKRPPKKLIYGVRSYPAYRVI